MSSHARLLLKSLPALLALCVGVACGGQQEAQPATNRTPSAASPPAGPCHTDQDCDVAWLQLDCCGSMRAVGVRKGLRGEFERAVNPPERASCECLAAPTRVDSGPAVPTGAEVGVKCVKARCTTFANGS